MQLVAPIDIEDALRTDLDALINTGQTPEYAFFAPPAPDDLAPDSVQIMSVGGVPQTEVSNEHDVRVDCWAETPAEAFTLANVAAGAIATLPMQTPASGRQYTTARLDSLPYLNPDPNRPLIPRVSFRASVGIRGEAIF